MKTLVQDKTLYVHYCNHMEAVPFCAKKLYPLCKKRQRCAALISCWRQFLFPKQKHWRKSGISLFGFFFCSVQAAHTNGSCRGCFLDWTIFPLFNYVFIALRFTPEEIGNTWLLTAAARKVFHNTFSIHKLQFVLISASWDKKTQRSVSFTRFSTSCAVCNFALS